MNLTGYMEGKISPHNFLWILFNMAILFAELNHAEMHSFLSKDLPPTFFQMPKSLHVFLLSSALEKSKDLCCIKYKVITDCKKDTLIKLSRDSYMHFLRNHTFHQSKSNLSSQCSNTDTFSDNDCLMIFKFWLPFEGNSMLFERLL